ncbi:TPA: hypothetical protein HA244_05795 [Candidatus Micrarchaeota archaeon]|nr:hypothetical protein [Candidatus Micrarchaeota archaeon]
MAEYKKLYITWVSSSYASIFIQTAFTYGIPHVAPVATVILIAVSEAANNYFQAKQFQINAQAIEYTSLCQDQQYKVLSYQALKPQATGDTGKTKVDSTLSGLSDLTKSIAAGLFSKPQDDKARLAGFQELLNLRSEITNQKGFIQSPEVFYVHVEQSPSMMPTHLFDQLNGNGCKLSENDVLSNGDVLQIENGLRLVKPDGTTAFDFNSFYWQLRAASILRSQELARMIIPNTIITTQLACGDKPFISITPAGSGSLVDKSCPAGDCLARQLNALVKFDGISLEQVLGKITSVDTDLGTVSFLGNSISFTRFSLGENAGEKPGVETRSPSLDYLASSGLGTSTAGSSLDVLGNANVVLNAPAGDFGKMDVGSLKTIIAEKGKIEYDPVAKRLYVFVYVLGEGQAQTIADVVARPSQVNIPGEAPIPAINLQLQGKTGFEDVVRQLQDSLDQVQKDSTGGKGGFQVLETPDSIYYLFDNTLRKIDKATGQQQDFHLTGSPTTGPDGSIIFPTDKGPITIKPGVDDKGQPIITVNGPGFKDEGPLESAKGPSGIFTFNPSTGAITVYNGQDIPMDPRFATQGMGFTGTPDGTVGLPTQNPFLLPPAPSDDGFNRKTSLSLPAWPENPVYFTLMLGIVLVGIAFVRRKHS